MLKRRVLGRWTIDVDIEATRAVYEGIDSGCAEECDCAGCRNFRLARGEVYPQEALVLLESLGIDAGKEAESFHIVTRDSGLSLYGGWFHFIGRIVEGDDVRLGPVKTEALTDGFRYKLQSGRAVAHGAFRTADAVLEFQFYTDTVPWLMEEPNPYAR